MQLAEAERFDALVREGERLDLANLTAHGFTSNKVILDRMQTLKREMSDPLIRTGARKTLAEIRAHADEQYARHHGLKIREH